MLRSIALRGVRAHKNVAHIQHRLKAIYRNRNRVEELSLQLKKQTTNHAKLCGD